MPNSETQKSSPDLALLLSLLRGILGGLSEEDRLIVLSPFIAEIDTAKFDELADLAIAERISDPTLVTKHWWGEGMLDNVDILKNFLNCLTPEEIKGFVPDEFLAYHQDLILRGADDVTLFDAIDDKRLIVQEQVCKFIHSANFRDTDWLSEFPDDELWNAIEYKDDTVSNALEYGDVDVADLKCDELDDEVLADAIYQREEIVERWIDRGRLEISSRHLENVDDTTLREAISEPMEVIRHWFDEQVVDPQGLANLPVIKPLADHIVTLTARAEQAENRLQRMGQPLRLLARIVNEGGDQ